MSIETLNILNGISQAIANTHDGALDSEGDKVELGLKREEGDPLLDPRVMDGFSVKVAGNKLWVCYHTECKLQEVHDSKFESNIESMISDVVSFLKKEFKKLTGTALSLKKPEEVKIVVENISRIRTAVYASKCFTLSAPGFEDRSKGSDEKRVDQSIRDFLSLKSTSGAKNNKAPKDTHTPFDPNRMKFGQRK